MLLLAAVLCLAKLDTCRLDLLSVTTVNSAGQNAPPNPNDSDIRILVRFKVTGEASPFKLRINVGGHTLEQEFSGLRDWEGGALYHNPWPPETKTLVRVELDPQHTSGAATASRRVFSDFFYAPAVPSQAAVQVLGAKVYNLSEQAILTFPQNAAGNLVTIRCQHPSNSSVSSYQLLTIPDDTKGIWDFYRRRVPGDGMLRFTRDCRATLWGTRVDAARLRLVTWGRVHSDHSQDFFLGGNKQFDVDSVAVKNWVSEALGDGFQSRLSPFDCAHLLFRKQMARLRYKITQVDVPSKVLADGMGQCMSGNRLFAACLRQIGIPARTMGNFNHLVCEFYLSGIGWIPADATPLLEPASTDYLFANVNYMPPAYFFWVDDKDGWDQRDFGHVVAGPTPTTTRWISTLSLGTDRWTFDSNSSRSD